MFLDYNFIEEDFFTEEKEENIKLTPMMKQYRDIKEKYSDSIVFFRIGDFYEVFFEDVKKISEILRITLIWSLSHANYKHIIPHWVI